MNQWLPTLITCLTSAFSIVLSFFMGRLVFSLESKAAVKRERYEKFYVPYINLLIGGRLDRIRFSEFSMEARGRFFDLIFQNPHLIDANSAQHLQRFYDAEMDMLEYEEGNAGYENAPAELDATFASLSRSILFEASRLSRAVHLPDIGKEFRRVYTPDPPTPQSSDTTPAPATDL